MHKKILSPPPASFRESFVARQLLTKKILRSAPNLFAELLASFGPREEPRPAQAIALNEKATSRKDSKIEEPEPLLKAQGAPGPGRSKRGGRGRS